MAEKIKLVQGDTRPQLTLSLTDDTTGDPIDVSTATVRMRFRALGSTAILATLTASKIAGRVLEDGTISTASPFNTPGVGGRCVISWSSEALNQPAGDYEGEIEITFADATVQTVYDTLKFKLRSQFA